MRVHAGHEQASNTAFFYRSICLTRVVTGAADCRAGVHEVPGATAPDQEAAGPALPQQHASSLGVGDAR